MRTLLRLTTTALALLAFAGHAPAQILTSAEVQRAMELGQAENHATLRAHFLALSARYRADARRHLAFARAAAGGHRGAGAAAAAHHERLATLATDAAAVTAELAIHHQTLGAGLASTAPWGGEAFEAGAGAPAIPSERRLMALAARAARPSEHGELREYYLMLAGRSEAAANGHRAMARTYRNQGRSNEPAAAHCDMLATLETRAASEARALARDHE